MTIVSASRRTDIPAFFGDWFMNRLSAGYCLVANPFNRSQVRRVSLAAEDVDAVVFWTKNPAPFLHHVLELEKQRLRYYFQYTLNDYPKALEPGLSPVEDRIEAFRALSNIIGSRRVVWRYDPIIPTGVTDFEAHRNRFKSLAKVLSGHTRRVVVSLVDRYRKTLRRLARLEKEGLRVHWEMLEGPCVDRLLEDLASIAGECGLEMRACSEPRDFSGLGIPPGACIDADLITDLFGIATTHVKDRGQRPRCGCVESRDIGAVDTCGHGCPYCYATNDPDRALLRLRDHDPSASALDGKPVRS